MTDKKSKATKPIMDVSRPGKTAPPPNSKSVIISNRPILKDPMVVDDKPDNSLAKVSNRAKERLLTAPLLETENSDEPVADPEVENKPAAPIAPPKKMVAIKSDPADPKTEAVKAAEPKPASPAKPSKVIAPIDAKPPLEEPKPKAEVKQPEADNKEPTTEPETENKPAPDKPADQAKAESDQTSGPAPEEDKPAATDQDSEPTVDAAAPAKDQPIRVEDDKEAKRQAAIEELAESKKYYLPINMVEKRRSKHFAIVGIVLSLLLIVAWADIALDAGLISMHGVKPLTHFFSN